MFTYFTKNLNKKSKNFKFQHLKKVKILNFNI